MTTPDPTPLPITPTPVTDSVRRAANAAIGAARDAGRYGGEPWEGQYDRAVEALHIAVRALAEGVVPVAEKDNAYEERNRLVALVARWAIDLMGQKAGLGRTAIAGWDEEWHGIVYIDTPVGQLSWHYHDSHAPLFEGLPAYEGEWDGHDTPEKYRRVAILALTPNAPDWNFEHKPTAEGPDGQAS